MILVAVHCRAFDRRDIQRAGHELDHGIQHLLNALVAVSRSTGHRYSRTFAAAFPKRCLQVVNCRFLAFKILKHQLLIEVTQLLHHLAVPFFSFVGHLFGDSRDTDFIALIIFIDVGFHFKQVDDTFKVIFLTDRYLNADRILTQAVLDLLHAAIEIGADHIHLIDECHTRNIVLICLSPDIFRLRLNTTLCSKNTYRSVKDTQGTFNFNREVYMAWRINDIDTVLKSAGHRFCFFFQSPVAGCRCRSDGNTTLLFLSHPVHGCGTVMRFADLVINSCIIQDPLGKSGLAGIDMSHDTDVSGPLKRILSSRSSH